MKKWLKHTIGWIILAIIIMLGYSAYSVWTYGNTANLKKTDAAIVLGAAAWGREPSPVLRERINHAIWLYNNDYVEKIIFTGGKIDENDLTESEVSRLYAIDHGVKKEDILLEMSSLTTEENLENALEIGNDNGLLTYSIVSDPLHMKRAMAIARDMGMEAYSSPTNSSAFQTAKTKFPFFIREFSYYIAYEVSNFYSK